MSLAVCFVLVFICFENIHNLEHLSFFKKNCFWIAFGSLSDLFQVTKKASLRQLSLIFTRFRISSSFLFGKYTHTDQLKMSYMLSHLHNGWQVDQAILSEEDRVVVIRFGK